MAGRWPSHVPVMRVSGLFHLRTKRCGGKPGLDRLGRCWGRFILACAKRARNGNGRAASSRRQQRDAAGSSLMSLFRDTSLSAVSSIVSVGGRAVVTVVLARGLAPTIYGEFVFLQWLIELFSLICSFGLAGSMTRFFPGLSGSQGAARSPVLGYFARLVAVSVGLSTALFVVYLAYTQAPDIYGYAVFITWSIVSESSAFLGSAL